MRNPFVTQETGMAYPYIQTVLTRSVAVAAYEEANFRAGACRLSRYNRPDRDERGNQLDRNLGSDSIPQATSNANSKYF